MKIKKLQSGGMPPLFSTFTPVTVTNPYAGVDPMLLWLKQMGVEVVGGASASGSSKSSSSSGSSASGMPTMKDTMALLKDMKGLDSDVSVAITLLQRASLEAALEAAAFGTSSGLISSYYRNIDMANKVAENKLAYDDAYKVVEKNGGISEAAITSDGKVIVRDSSNNIKAISPSEYLKNKNKYLIQTNGNLLYARSHDKSMAFNNSVLEVVQNGVSFEKVATMINTIASKLGTSTNSIEGYTAKEALKILNGIAILKKAAEENSPNMPMDGIYKTGIKETSQQNQVKLAIDVLYAGLGENYKTLLKLKSDGTDVGAKSMVAAILMSRADETKEYTMNYDTSLNKEFNIDGSKKADSDDSLEKQVKTNPALQFFLGYGNKGTLVIQNKTKHGIVFTANNMPLMDKSNNPMPLGTLYDVGQGQFGGLLDIENATMGEVRLSRSGVNNVIVEGGQIYAAELPIDPNSKVPKPEFRFLRTIEKANEELQKMGINPSGGNTLTPEDIKKINQVYEKYKLPVKYQSNGELTANYARFAMVNATATKEAFDDDPTFGSGVMVVSDDNERANFENNMRKLSGNDKYNLSDGYLFGAFKKDDLYKGTIFIPVYNNVWNALATTDSKISPSVSKQIEGLQQQTDLRMSYKSPASWVNK